MNHSFGYRNAPPRKMFFVTAEQLRNATEFFNITPLIRKSVTRNLIAVNAVNYARLIIVLNSYIAHYQAEKIIKIFRGKNILAPLAQVFHNRGFKKETPNRRLRADGGGDRGQTAGA